jgi:predicted protein tyrosine phosphatase
MDFPVSVLSREEFTQHLAEVGINDSTVASSPCAYISIIGSISYSHKFHSSGIVISTESGQDQPILRCQHKNYLTLRFDDVSPEDPSVIACLAIKTDPDGYPCLFAPEQAARLAQFILENAGAEHWIIHCGAGISRSGAVGAMISDHLGLPYSDFKRYNPRVNPNTHVAVLLRKALYEATYKDTP